ncbi:SDR family oxidoreductase [Bradyrhizobium sp.]|jgi:NAD(P)-dependent dehydrogenase (short-subunit alcohol dehydrogenase family)|uniref:SDR family oxidoreductase n=1 Tax=Bradyrhizobium sp. TaxID=376 RepID=UPI002DDD8BFF|nr:SDR family oxidoreductase [Bradyrhizobium sp.]HEV2160513.1 SDR family oxidoreductase [Bradyrhizobium sp.]
MKDQQIMRLKNKVAIITGAAAGIGAATVKLFAAEGARVVVADWNEAGARALAQEIGESAFPIAVDVRNSAAVRSMVSACVERFGKLDVLVNNAGKGALGTVVTANEEEWDDIVSINLKSIFLCSKFAIPIMASSGGGVIVNTASNIAQVGIKDRAAYVAAKGGVASLTRAMALDHAAENIRVNAVCPGVIWSTYFDKMLQEVPDPDAFIAGLKARAPMGRVGQPEEIASMMLWLASEESSFATGGMFTVDGGMTAW